MIKIFTIYCAGLVVLLAYANYQGYVFSNIFDSQSHAAQSSNRYHK
jgi:hypothetical protein